jgi:methylthioribose-1-phosphate isomerase
MGIIVLDQTRLPAAVTELALDTVEGIEEAIVSLRVRGAPLIGIAGAMGLAALVNKAAAQGVAIEELRPRAIEWANRLVVARPTAVNLSWAIDRMRGIIGSVTGESNALAAALIDEADRILTEDDQMCRSIGRHGATLLGEGSTVLTHCNAGALATGGIGTALSPVYIAHERGLSIRVYADETRPLLQGSRLTAWELEKAGIDVTVLTDGMAGALMASDPPDFVFVGADRIAANGDVANKVGTYGLAVLARHHGIPMYVLAPTSTVDFGTPTGAEIPIEFRDGEEVRGGFGAMTAPEDVPVWSPAFDVTPAGFITGIITQHGIHRSPYTESLARLRTDDA